MATKHKEIEKAWEKEYAKKMVIQKAVLKNIKPDPCQMEEVCITCWLRGEATVNMCHCGNGQMVSKAMLEYLSISSQVKILGQLIHELWFGKGPDGLSAKTKDKVVAWIKLKQRNVKP